MTEQFPPGAIVRAAPSTKDDLSAYDGRKGTVLGPPVTCVEVEFDPPADGKKGRTIYVLPSDLMPFIDPEKAAAKSARLAALDAEWLDLRARMEEEANTP
jgi:hypothetical protein